MIVVGEILLIFHFKKNSESSGKVVSSITLPIYAVFVWLGTLLFLLFLVLMMRHRLGESQKKVERAMDYLQDSDPQVKESVRYLKEAVETIDSLR